MPSSSCPGSTKLWGRWGSLPCMAAPHRLHREAKWGVRGCRTRASQAAAVCGVCCPGWGSQSWVPTPQYHWGQKWGADTPRSHPTCSSCASKRFHKGAHLLQQGGGTQHHPQPRAWAAPAMACGTSATGGGANAAPAPLRSPPKSHRSGRGASGGRHRALARCRQPLGCKGWEKGRQFLPAARMPW